MKYRKCLISLVSELEIFSKPVADGTPWDHPK
jgi:hypothetical protein